jgi:hypothetical protein
LESIVLKQSGHLLGSSSFSELLFLA